MSGWLSSVVQVAAAVRQSLVVPSSRRSELRPLWGQVRKFFQMVDQTPDAEADARVVSQLPEIKNKFDAIVQLLREERKQEAYEEQDVKQAVFVLDPEDSETGCFAACCTQVKTCMWPALKAIVVDFLVDAIVAVDGYRGEQLVEVAVYLVDATEDCLREIGEASIQLAVARVVELACKSSTTKQSAIDEFKPRRSSLSGINFSLSCIDSVVSSPLSSSAMRSVLESFAFLVISRPHDIDDKQMTTVVGKAFTRLNQQTISLCSLPATAERQAERRSLATEVADLVRFIGILFLSGSQRALPLVTAPLDGWFDIIEGLITATSNAKFRASTSLICLCLRASASPEMRDRLAAVLLRPAVVAKLQAGIFDGAKGASQSALAALAIVFEMAPAAAMSSLLCPAGTTVDVGPVAVFDPRTEFNATDVFGSYIAKGCGPGTSLAVEAERLPALTPEHVRDSLLVKELCNCLSSAYDQHASVTEACILVVVSVLALPSAAVWRGVVGSPGQLAPLASVVRDLAERQFEGGAQKAREGETKAALRVLCSEMVHLANLHATVGHTLEVAEAP